MKLLNIATIIALSTVVDHSSSQVLATTTLKTSEYELEQEEDEDDATTLGILATAKKTSQYETEYEYETIPEQEEDEDDASLGILATTTKTLEYETETISKQEDDAVSVLPLLRGVKKAVNQFLSDSDSEELSCAQEADACHHDNDCCGNMTCDSLSLEYIGTVYVLPSLYCCGCGY